MRNPLHTAYRAAQKSKEHPLSSAIATDENGTRMTYADLQRHTWKNKAEGANDSPPNTCASSTRYIRPPRRVATHPNPTSTGPSSCHASKYED